MAVGKIRIGTEIDTKNFDKQVAYIEDKIEDIEAVLSDEKLEFDLRLKNEAELERLQNQLISIKTKMNDFGDTSVKQTTKMSDGFKKSTKGIKQFALSLISVGSIFALISKASTSYLETDEKLSSQIQANWVGLGTILEPIINLIVNLMKKGVTAILYFMSQLTGVDYIAKANAAALKKQEKATKDLTKANQKYTASFDEMNIAQDTTSSSASGSGIGLELFSISDLGNDTIKIIERIAKALKPITKGIKDIIDWALDNPDTLAKILGGTALIGLIGKIIGNKSTGLLGIKTLLASLATMGVISIVINVKEMYEQGKKTKKVVEEVNEKLEEKDKLQKKEINNYKENTKNLQKNTKATDEQSKSLNKITNETINYASAVNQGHKEAGLMENAVRKLTGEYQQTQKVIRNNIDNSFESLMAQREMYEQGLLNEEQTKQYKETLQQFNETMFGTSKESKELREEYGNNTASLLKLKVMQDEVNKSMLDTGQKSLGVTKGINNITESLKKIPNKTTINIDTTKINTAKTQVDKLKDSLLDIVKKATKIDLGINFGGTLGGLQSGFEQLFKKFGIKTTKLAVGGIVNNPGRGVSMHDIRTGESGAEGILPLTDPNAMSELGYAIGKWITINLTNVTKLDNRTISKEQKKINNETSFATNGRL